MVYAPRVVKWLIESQLELLRAERDAHLAGDLVKARELMRRRKRLEQTWRRHPLYFEISGPTPRRRNAQTQVIQDGIRSALSRHDWLDAPTLVEVLLTQDLKRQMRAASIQKALQKMLLEGSVRHKFGDDGQTVVWSLRD